MPKRLSRTLLGTLLLGSFFLLGVPNAGAQVSEGVQLKPAVIEDKANPGDTYTFSITATNISQEERTFFLVTNDIKSVDDRGVPVFSDAVEHTKFQMSTWITLPAQSIVLKAGESKTIPFVVHVPADASPGSHFGGVFLDSRPPAERTTGAAVAMKVGSIVSLRIAGDATEEARIREFSTEKLIYSTPDINFTTKIENLGNTLLRPAGFLEINDMFGKKVASLPVNGDGAGVYPGTNRPFVTEWHYDRFAFGRYQAVVSTVYGDDVRKTISATASFWVLPLKPILIVVGILFGSLFALFMAVRVYVRKKLREMGVASVGQTAGVYNKRYQRSVSRLMILIMTVLAFTIIFLGVLFLMFA